MSTIAPLPLEFFDFIQSHLDADQQLKEDLRPLTRELEHVTKILTAQVNQLHLSATDQDIAAICTSLRARLVVNKQALLAVKALVPSDKYFRYRDMWGFHLKQMCFVAALVVYLEEETLISIKQLEELVGLPFDVPTDFSIEVEDFLHGLCGVTSELARLSVNCVTVGNLQRPVRIAHFVSSLFSGFQLINLKNDSLRRRFDAIKYDVKKIEEIVCDVTLRKNELNQ